MYNKLLLLKLFFLLFLNVNGQKDTIIKTYYEDGKIKNIAHYKIGVNAVILAEYTGVKADANDLDLVLFSDTLPIAYIDGTAIEYYENGLVKSEGVYNKTNKEGEWVTNYRSGKISSIYNYKDGIFVGEAKSYNEAGNLTNNSIFDKNRIHENDINTYYIYYDDGQLKDISNFKGPYRHGIYKTFYENGAKNDIGTYKNGLLFGIRTLYHDNGQLKVTWNYINGKTEGESKIFDKDGKLESVANYNNDKLNGIFKSYTNGILGATTNYTDGKRNGTQKLYYDNGKLLCVINYKNDLQDGLYTVYYENGKVTKSGSYLQNKLNGKWSFFDERGLLIEEQIWVNDNKINTKVYRKSNPNYNYNSPKKVASKK